MEAPNYKRYFLRILIAALSISAAIGIFIFLVGDFGEIETKILLTTLTIGGCSLTGLCSSVIYHRQELKIISTFGMITSIFCLVMSTISIWEFLDLEDTWQILLITIILSVGMGHISLLLQIKSRSVYVRYSLIATITFIVIVAAMLIKSTVGVFDEGELYFRLLGVFSILDVLGTVATPILNHAIGKK